MEPRTLLSAVTWTGDGGDNNWDTAANWSTDSVPGSGDDVTINVVANVVHSENVTDSINSLTSTEPLTISGGTLSIASASTIDNTLSLTGGTLTEAGDVNVSGLVTLTSGTLSGSGAFNANGGMLITDNTTGSSAVILDGCTVNNPAGQTATWSGGQNEIEMSDGAVFNNLGTFLAQASVYFTDDVGAASSFVNTGSITSSADSVMDVAFNVPGGSVDIQTGSFILGNGGSSTGAAFNVESPGSLVFGSPYTFDTSSTITGAGQMDVGLNGSNSPLILPGNYTLTGPTVVGAGALQVDGSLAESAVSDSGDGGALSGTGTVGPITVNLTTVSPGDGGSPGMLNADGSVVFGALDDSGGGLVVALNGPTAGADYSQLNVNGNVELDPNGSYLDATLGFTPASGEQFTIIKSTAPVVGNFDGLPEGASLTLDNTTFTISYHGGDGNDVVLTQSGATAPAVAGISPTSGPAAGGTSVTIMGSGFTGATAVDFGTNLATGLTVVNDTTITADSPAGTGTVDVTVMTPGGTSATSSADEFTYTVAAAPTVTGVSPSSGPAAGGTSVTITGSGFSGTTAVEFGTTPATGVIVDSSTTITAVSPASAGVADVSVTTPAGTSATSPADQFTYIVASSSVMSVSRFGFHMHPTSLVIQFDGPLDAASAQNIGGYAIIGPNGQRVAIASAVYDATTRSVTLSPVTRLNLHYAYNLIVRGTGTDPIEDQVGDAIDGDNDGKTGSDYQTKITAANLVILGNHPSVRKTLAAILAKEKRALARHRSS